MRPNSVKRALGQGGVSVGTFVFEFATTGVARLASGAGAEFVVFDLEHPGHPVEEHHAPGVHSESAAWCNPTARDRIGPRW